MDFLSDAFEKLESSLASSSGISSRSITNTNTTVTTTNDASSSASSSSLSMGDVVHYSSNATRWEKAVVGAHAIVAEVTKFDPDGVAIVMVGGGGQQQHACATVEEENDDDGDEEEEEKNATTDDDDDDDDDDNADTACSIEWHRNVKNTEGLETLVTAKEPKGACLLGKAMKEALTDALSKDLSQRPCSILVLTAGAPDDPDVLEQALQDAVQQQVAKSGGIIAITPSLSVTFIQIGNDPDASEYLQHLGSKAMTTTTAAAHQSCRDCNSEDTTAATAAVDAIIVDTMAFAEITETMETMSDAAREAKRSGAKGTTGAVVGALAGAALGAGGMYLASSMKAKKRTKTRSWQGKWKCLYDEEEIAILDVTDDPHTGTITIDGLVETMHGTYGNNTNNVGDDEFFIQFTDPNGDVVTGDFDDTTFVLTWSDGTRWEALNKPSAGAYIGAAAAGAALVGGTGYMINKKCFNNKMQAKDYCDYIIVIDRSVHMNQRDK